MPGRAHPEATDDPALAAIRPSPRPRRVAAPRGRRPWTCAPRRPRRAPRPGRAARDAHAADARRAARLVRGPSGRVPAGAAVGLERRARLAAPRGAAAPVRGARHGRRLRAPAAGTDDGVPRRRVVLAVEEVPGARQGAGAQGPHLRREQLPERLLRRARPLPRAGHGRPRAPLRVARLDGRSAVDGQGDRRRLRRREAGGRRAPRLPAHRPGRYGVGRRAGAGDPHRAGAGGGVDGRLSLRRPHGPADDRGLPADDLRALPPGGRRRVRPHRPLGLQRRARAQQEPGLGWPRPPAQPPHPRGVPQAPRVRPRRPPPVAPLGRRRLPARALRLLGDDPRAAGRGLLPADVRLVRPQPPAVDRPLVGAPVARAVVDALRHVDERLRARAGHRPPRVPDRRAPRSRRRAAHAPHGQAGGERRPPARPAPRAVRDLRRRGLGPGARGHEAPRRLGDRPRRQPREPAPRSRDGARPPQARLAAVLQ